MSKIEDVVETIKDKIPDITPTPPHLHPIASPHELKSRLEWGEPALTILDIRDSSTFRECHVMGAMNAPAENIIAIAEASLSRQRDIYLYGRSDQEAANIAAALREAGFQHVAQLEGGLDMWREIGGALEGTATEQRKPEADAYNVVSRIGQFKEERNKEKALE
jgi:rhodanese-related sulfurtransferase